MATAYYAKRLISTYTNGDDDLDLNYGLEHELFQEWILEMEMLGIHHLTEHGYPEGSSWPEELGGDKSRPGEPGKIVTVFENQELLESFVTVALKVADILQTPFTYVVEDIDPPIVKEWEF